MLSLLMAKIKQNQLLLVALIFLAVVQLAVIPFIQEPSVAAVLSVAVTVPAAYLVVFGSALNHYKAFVVASVYGVALLVIATAILFIIKPNASDWLAKEDFIIENMTAVAALLASGILFIIGVRFAIMKQLARGTIAALLAITFFVIGMEEISWMQRILDVESSEFFLANNIQAETNLHNLNTNLTMAIFYSLIFVIFIILPFFTKQVTSILKKIKLPQAALFIPSTWLSLPFAALLGLASFSSLLQPYHLVILTFTAMILVYYLAVKTPKDIKQLKFAIPLTFIAAATAAVIIQLIDYEGLGVRSWFPSEYRELFICVGIFLYAVDVAFRAFKGSRSSIGMS